MKGATDTHSAPQIDPPSTVVMIPDHHEVTTKGDALPDRKAP